jgi:hypothetical protein
MHKQAVRSKNIHTVQRLIHNVKNYFNNLNKIKLLNNLESLKFQICRQQQD